MGNHVQCMLPGNRRSSMISCEHTNTDLIQRLGSGSRHSFYPILSWNQVSIGMASWNYFYLCTIHPQLSLCHVTNGSWNNFEDSYSQGKAAVASKGARDSNVGAFFVAEIQKNNRGLRLDNKVYYDPAMPTRAVSYINYGEVSSCSSCRHCSIQYVSSLKSKLWKSKQNIRS